MNLQKQKENVAILMKLIQDNPDLPILPMVATDCVLDDEYGYWMARWSKAKIDKYHEHDGRVYMYSGDLDEMVEDWIDNNWLDFEGASYEELQKKAEVAIRGYKWVDAIVVYIEQD